VDKFIGGSEDELEEDWEDYEKRKKEEEQKKKMNMT